MLGGESAVPCNPQSALAGPNPVLRGWPSGSVRRGGVDGRVLRDVGTRIRSGPEGSSLKRMPRVPQASPAGAKRDGHAR